MRKKIVSWLKIQVKAAKAQGVVLGLSGGLDSCVAAVLAKQSLGSKRVLALLLPCHSHKQDRRDALLCARKFGIRVRTVDLSKVYDALLEILPAADRMTRANLRPRLRMLVLYYFARKMKYLVCGTSNKSELMAGYFTKFGDGASDILPLGDLYKTQVRCLAKALKVPRSVIDKAPTAGLWPGQTDEGEMGIMYPQLDDILARLEQGKKQLYPAGKVAKVKRMVAASAHKRRGALVCEF
ncbi:MAG: NAD+ synthase [Candidatus Omnitrophica bacterium]|nr:NAD+ synthase [Candidatus Omnitrophota bacterium]